MGCIVRMYSLVISLGSYKFFVMSFAIENSQDYSDSAWFPIVKYQSVFIKVQLHAMLLTDTQLHSFDHTFIICYRHCFIGNIQSTVMYGDLVACCMRYGV